MKLSNTTKRLLRASNGLQGQLADVLEVSIHSIWRYLRTDDIKLTSQVAVNFYKQTMGLKEDEIFETETAKA